MKNTLGGRIRGLRNSKNLSQKEFGKLFNLAESTIGMYERDERKPDYTTLQTIANHFSATREYLLSGKEVSLYSNADNDEESFQSFISDPELERWYKELPKSDEEDLRRLRRIWEAFKEDEK